MTKEEMIKELLEKLESLQDIEKSENPIEEAKKQIRFTLAKLEAFGVNTENLR